MFGCGLLHHILVYIALGVSVPTPGYYLHILIPWVAPALGVGFCSFFQNKQMRPFLIGLSLLGGSLLAVIKPLYNFWLRVHTYPFLWIIAFGGVMICLLLLIEAKRAFPKELSRRRIV
jgi:hypothetical protein